MANYKVAYGKKKFMYPAIHSGAIPPGCIILTEDSNEIFFYDLTRRLVTYESKSKFSSREEAEMWIRKYDCSGQIISVREGDKCNAYIVDYSGNLTSISSAPAPYDPSSPTTVVVQADFLIEDPQDPSYIKNKPTSYPIAFIEGLEEALASKMSITGAAIPGALVISDGNGNVEGSTVTLQSLVGSLNQKVEITDTIIEGSLMVSDGKGGLVHADATPQEIFSTLSRKVEVAGSVTPGSLMIATEDGNLQCCGIKSSDILRKDDIITGSVTSTVTIESAGVYVIRIPEDVLKFPSLHVYHNGMLLAEGTHYTRADNFITLIGHSTYDGDLFTFVGYGSTSNVSDIDGYHTHFNKEVLDSITQEMVDKWNNSTPDTSSFVQREELFGSDGHILPELLPDIGSGQENVIEAVAIGDNILPVVDKTVTIPVGTEDNLGVVKSSIGLNKVSIEEDGTMSVNSLDSTKLIVPEGEELILVSGDSTK